MEVRLKHELKVRESRLANLIESTSRAKQNESPVPQPAQTGVNLKKEKKESKNRKYMKIKILK